MPTKVYPVGRSADVLLACSAWRLRAPLRAQLIEDGYDVVAVASWEEAELLLRTRALRPRLVLFDVQEEPNPAAALASLVRLAAEAQVVVLASESVLGASDVRALGVQHVVARPFRIRDVEEKIAELLKGH